MKQVLLLLIFILSTGCAFAQETNLRFTPPPTGESAEIKSSIDNVQNLLETGKVTTTDLLTSPVYMNLHEYLRFRELIKKFAATGKTVIITPDEEGQSLIVSGSVFDKEGKPAKNALIYFYQTSAKGWYSEKAYHISGNEGDHRHARLFGYLKTDENGHYEFRTIKPSGYPGSELPAHIHFFVEIQDSNGIYRIGSEIQFEDDPRLTAVMRERSRLERAVICPVKRDNSGVFHVTADFTALKK